MIVDGRIALNGVVIDTPATILASLHGVTVDGNPVEAAAPARLFLYHKPSGVLVTERDPAGRPTIYDRLPRDLPRLVPVGRLDLNTEGLLLLTTDGELKRQLELPSTGVERAYRARAYGQVSQTQLEDLIEGVEIEGVRYGSIDANLERRTGANVWIEMILTEGKNREVRRVLEYLGLKVSRLIRTRYGPFILGDLPVGGIGEVRQHDIVAFRKDPKRLPPAEPAKFRETREKSASARPGGGGATAPRKDNPSPRRNAPGKPARPARPVEGDISSARRRRTQSDPRRARAETDAAPRPGRSEPADHHGPRPGGKSRVRTAGKARSADPPTGTKRPKPPPGPRAPTKRR
jgi:23S rRNA pseudouridine2605 synthase